MVTDLVSRELYRVTGGQSEAQVRLCGDALLHATLKSPHAIKMIV